MGQWLAKCDKLWNVNLAKEIQVHSAGRQLSQTYLDSIVPMTFVLKYLTSLIVADYCPQIWREINLDWVINLISFATQSELQPTFWPTYFSNQKQSLERET